MRHIIIGDLHGKDIWKRILNQETFDRVIFMGDYFDSFHILPQTQIDNFKDLVEFYSNNDVVLLIGNHDYHYLSEHAIYSGYQDALAETFKQ